MTRESIVAHCEKMNYDCSDCEYCKFINLNMIHQKLRICMLRELQIDSRMEKKMKFYKIKGRVKIKDDVFICTTRCGKAFPIKQKLIYSFSRYKDLEHICSLEEICEEYLTTYHQRIEK